MKSDIDIKDDVYTIVMASVIKGAVTGSIFKRKRPNFPSGYGKEDVCISVLANLTAQTQEAFVNVNVYVQDNDVDGQKEENTQRLRTLCQLSFKAFDYVHGPDFRLSMSEQRVLSCESTGEHIINNKLLYQTVND